MADKSKKKINKDISKPIVVEANINKNISLDLLTSYRRVLYEIKKFYDSVDFDSYGADIELKIKVTAAVLNSSEKLGKAIESLDKLEEKVKRDEKSTISRKGSAETSMFED